MKCKNCGAALIFRDGICFCENCGSTFQLEYPFENTDVYIGYVENDWQGRRTKDSILAAELYQKLQAKKINAFAERVSADNLADDELLAAKYQAIYNAKVILIVGTQKQNFQNLLEELSAYFGDKTIIPIYSDVPPEEIPSELNRLQALNYDAIGSDADLIKSVLNLLGRGGEVEAEQLRAESLKQKRRKIIIAVAAGIILLAVGIGIAVCMRPTPIEDMTPQQCYEKALELLEDGDMLGAAKCFVAAGDYNDSQNRLKTIYDRYDGYYQTESGDITFHIDIQNASTADITLTRIFEGGKRVRIKEAVQIIDNTINASFTDTTNTPITVNIQLTNEGIIVQTTSEATEEEITIGNLNLNFFTF